MTFDAIAAEYDSSFAEQRLGRMLRALVWEQLDTLFLPGMRVLDLGCGSGADALHLARRGLHVTALDASAEMVALTQCKAEVAGLAAHIAAHCVDLAQIASEPRTKNQEPLVESAKQGFDGALSNFGALNCLPDRRGLAQELAQLIRPGGKLALVLIGACCPWEIGWHLLRGEPAKALRRRDNTTAHIGHGATVRVWYPSPTQLCSEFAPWFRPLALRGVGVLLPPSYLAPLVAHYPRYFEVLAGIERGIAWRATNWSDHYLLILEKCL
ncbi:methyltransferase domain-containing protein [Candidatus Gracilibacteria bacterium]|nr:methyltransferase domain-containing protein [Candidatus Gracilibacteria bacterium]